MALVALVLLLGLAAAPAGAQELDRRIPVEPGGLLQVDLDMGEEVRPNRVSLDIRSHEADEVWAVADLSGLGASSITFRIDHDESGVRLYGRSGGLMSWLFGGPGVNVRVWVPREFSVDARSTSGPIRIEEISGEVRVRTAAAAIEVRAAEGTLHLRTRSGSVYVTEALGNVEVRASEGPIDVSWVTGGVEARTGSGDIRVQHIDGPVKLRTDYGELGLRDVRGPAEAKTERGAVYASFVGAPAGLLETRRGSVEVVFPGHVGCELEARSGQGTVQVSPGVQATGQRGADHFVGSVNDGGPPLRVYTARGSVRVDRR